MKQQVTGMRHHVPTVDHGIRVLMNRNIENAEAP